MSVTLYHLANRVELDLRMLKIHPEKEDMLKAKLQKDTEAMIDCVLKNANDPKAQEMMKKIIYSPEEA